VNNEQWNETSSQWVPYSKDVYTYDANGNMTQYIYYYRDDDTGKLVFYYKYTYTADSKGNLTQSISYDWDEAASQWLVFDRDEYTYNASGNLIQHLDYYNFSGSTSQLTYKEEFTYNANGSMTQYLNFTWAESTSQWMAFQKGEYTYDAARNQTHYNNYQWNKVTSQWDATNRNEYTYDASGNMVQYLGHYWSIFTNEWINSTKYEYTYDAAGNVTQYLDYSLNETTNQLVAYYKDEYTYDANGNIIQYLVHSLDENTNQWVSIGREEFTFNNTYSFNDLMLPFYYTAETSNLFSIFDILYRHMILSSLAYIKDDTDSWIQASKSINYYSEQGTTNLNDIETGDIQLYPNPVSENFNVSFRSKSNSANFELFDILGHKLFSKNVSNNEQLSLKNLNNGIYLYNLYIDGTRQSGKLIKK
jgi:hypothetical protein